MSISMKLDQLKISFQAIIFLFNRTHWQFGVIVNNNNDGWNIVVDGSGSEW